MKKKILIFISHYIPGNKMGGPIQSIRNMCEYLKDDFELYIYTSNHDFGEIKPYENIISNEWIKKQGVNIYYASEKNINFKQIKKILKKDIDLVYLNSFFSFKFSVLPLLINNFFIKNQKKILLATRGEFSPGALELKKFKKKIFMSLVKFTKVYKGINWHATSIDEKKEIENFIKGSKVYQVSNLKILTNIEKKNKKEKNLLKLIYVSRIHPKKNLMYLLNLLDKLEIEVGEKIILDIYGPIEDKIYWKNCLEIILKKRDRISINYKGNIANNSVSDIISKYDFFILPTLGENFGHVIMESFIAKTPIIISNTTPWKDLKSKNIGEEIELEYEEKWISTLKKLLLLDKVEYQLMIKSVESYLEKEILMNKEVEKMKSVLKKI